MEQKNIQVNETPNQDSLEDFKKIFFKVLGNWYWIVVSVGITITIAYLINRYTPPVYTISNSLLIKSQKDISNSVAGLLYGDEIFKGTSNLENESLLIKRFNLVEQTLNDLDFLISYFVEGNIRVTEIYPSKPIRVLIDTSSTLIPYNVFFKCIIKDRKSFLIRTEHAEWKDHFSRNPYNFGDIYNVNGFNFSIVLNDYFIKDYQSNEILFVINDIESLTDNYIEKLKISPVKRESSILQVSLEGTHPQKEVDFLNTLSENYIASGLEEKNINATRTINFIDGQLINIRDSLQFIETRLQTFKSKNSSVNLSTEGAQLYSNIQELEREKASLLVKAKYLDYLRDYIRNEKDFEQVVVPSSLGIIDPVLNNLIDKLVALQLEIKVTKTNERQENPLVKINRQKINEIKISLLENINNLNEATKIALSDLNMRINLVASSMQKLPGAEREFINIQRMYNLSETLYLFLMEKRAEASIAKASNTADFKVVNAARIKGIGGPIKPRPIRNYMVAVILGIIFPVSVIYIVNLFNNKINTQDELLALTSIPFLGIIGHSKNEEELIVSNNPKSVISESFRTIRSNLRYLSENEHNSKTYLITSSVSGEGKTFCAKNLAYIFSISGKKTLLVNADLRKKSAYKQLGIGSSLGLSNYLAGMATKEEVIQKTNQENLYILTSGDIPPNPSELLLSERMDHLINSLKNEFDYIFLDTPPIGILSDGLELTKFSDVNIFMVRQDYSLKAFIQSLNHMYIAGKIKHVALLLNDVNFSKMKYGYGYNYGYGYGYGYGYDQEIEKRKPLWKKVFAC